MGVRDEHLDLLMKSLTIAKVLVPHRNRDAPQDRIDDLDPFQVGPGIADEHTALFLRRFGSPRLARLGLLVAILHTG